MSTLTLLDIADRVSHNVACIHQAANHTIPFQSAAHRGPFTAALLSKKPLTTFLRDAYPGEARLLSVAVDEAGDGATTATTASLMDTVTGGGEGRTTPTSEALTTLTRRQIVSATPLRRKNEVGPAGEGGDVFFKSALKLIERYRAGTTAGDEERDRILGLLDRYDELQKTAQALRKSMVEISAQIPANQAQRTDEYRSVKQAQQAVRDVEGRVAEARRKRDALRLRLHNLKNPGSSSLPNSSLADTSMASTANTTTDFSPMAFGSGGGRESQQLLTSEAIPSGLNFGQNLYSSTMTPNRPQPPPAPRADSKEEAFWGGGGGGGGGSTGKSQGEDDEEEQEEQEAGEEDETVVLSLHRLPPREPSPPPLAPILDLPKDSSPPPEEEEEEEEEEVESLMERDASIMDGPMVFSPKLEEITIKLWATVGDVVLPGHTYGKGGEPFPGAEETIKLLRTQSLAPNSTSNSSLTAKMLLVLLTSPSSEPAPIIPMAELKKAVEDLAEERGFGKNLGVKTVYGCVAKKLVKIDRRGKEPMVTFDV